MDHSAFISCIGKAEESTEVQKLLLGLGVTKKLKMPEDDIDVRHSLHDLGVCLIFKPEGPASSALIFNAVQFVSSMRGKIIRATPERCQAVCSFPMDRSKPIASWALP